MKILLCAATEGEIAPTVQYLATHKTDVSILITGVGLLAATYSLTKAVAVQRPHLLLQAGIAGTFNETQALGSVVAVQSETAVDLGVEEDGSFRSLFHLGLLDRNAHPWTDEKLTNTNGILSTCGLPLVNGLTVNEISTNKKRMAHYTTAYNAQVESMEGAALHYVGLMEAVPFLQLRSLSNFVGERDKSRWKMKDAIANLNTELQRLLKRLTE